MAYNFNETKKRLAETETWLKSEFAGIRTGRATPAVLDGISIEAYGSFMPINQVASISVEDARTLRVSPWDATLVKAIEQGITKADLGISVSVDESGLRALFPPLTSERRDELARVAKKRLEDGRIRVRDVRDDTWKEIQDGEKNGSISEDEKFRLKDEMQKYIDASNAGLEALYTKKEQEIRE